MSMPFIACLALANVLVTALAPPAHSAERIDLVLKLVESDGRPMASTPVRVVLILGNDWQSANSGLKMVTSPEGELSASMNATLERRMLKRPTNFFSQLINPKEPTVHVVVAVEMQYLEHTWLALFAIDRFENGDITYHQYPEVWGQDKEYRFSQRATYRDNMWHLPGVVGALSTAPFRAEHATITPMAGGWKVNLTIVKAAEPRQR